MSSSLGNRDRAASPRPSFQDFFSYGFRPFFLGAAVYAALLMPVWSVWIMTSAEGGGSWLAVPGGPFAWHAHELIFGFALAAVAGFLLTAVPNWTGALPLSGSPLVALFLFWLAGRLAMTASPLLPYGVVAATDLAFVPALCIVAARQLLVKPAARNLVFLLLLAAITAANALYHAAAGGLIAHDPLDGPRAALMIIGLMITIIGGRIIPAFTSNWLHLNRPELRRPTRIGMLDAASVASVAAFAALAITWGPVSVPAALAAAAACALNATRLILWRGWTTLNEPIVWVLHAGYAWVVVAMALFAVIGLKGSIPSSLAFHALSTGAAGTMILAVMSRAALGHTGRTLVAPRAIVWSYVLITLAALARVFGPLIFPAHTQAILTLAALAWTVSFALFAIVYAPILTTPRVHTKLHP